jgi:hypothetical protein
MLIDKLWQLIEHKETIRTISVGTGILASMMGTIAGKEMLTTEEDGSHFVMLCMTSPIGRSLIKCFGVLLKHRKKSRTGWDLNNEFSFHCHSFRWAIRIILKMRAEVVV